eukprot:13059816-Heterocapsa_arctica.AAC.1
MDDQNIVFDSIGIDFTLLQYPTFDELDTVYTKFDVKAKVKTEVFMGLPIDVWEILHDLGKDNAQRAEWPSL